MLNLQVQPKVVKIFGVGGLRQLEAYQTGIFVSPEGHILTVQSLVLDDEEVTVVLSSGARATGKVTAVDPLLEIALVKIELGEPVEFFELDDALSLEPGARVFAFANVFGIAVYDEPVSMLHGVVTSIVPLSARRGAFQANYSGPVYVVDAATNNPGAAGGAVVDLQGRLVGLVGKELRSEVTETWLNYALPVSALREPVERLKAGEAVPPADEPDVPSERRTPADYGLVLVPDVVERTPPFVERVVPNSAAAKAGVRSDDLIVGIGTRTVASQRDLVRLLGGLEADKVELTLLRGTELIRIALQNGQE